MDAKRKNLVQHHTPAKKSKVQLDVLVGVRPQTPPARIAITPPTSPPACNYTRTALQGEGTEGTVWRYDYQRGYQGKVREECPTTVAVKMAKSAYYDKHLNREKAMLKKLTQECPDSWPMLYDWNIEHKQAEHEKDTKIPLLVMQFKKNSVMKDIFQLQKSRNLDLARKMLLKICRNVLCTLGDSERNAVVLTDVKPQNMLSDDGKRVVLTDAPSHAGQTMFTAEYTLWRFANDDCWSEEIWGVAVTMIQIISAATTGDSSLWIASLQEWIVINNDFPLPSSVVDPEKRKLLVSRGLSFIRDKLFVNCNEMRSEVAIVLLLMESCQQKVSYDAAKDVLTTAVNDISKDANLDDDLLTAFLIDHDATADLDIGTVDSLLELVIFECGLQEKEFTLQDMIEAVHSSRSANMLKSIMDDEGGQIASNAGLVLKDTEAQCKSFLERYAWWKNGETWMPGSFGISKTRQTSE